jgi:hypothetical protein
MCCQNLDALTWQVGKNKSIKHTCKRNTHTQPNINKASASKANTATTTKQQRNYNKTVTNKQTRTRITTLATAITNIQHASTACCQPNKHIYNIYINLYKSAMTPARNILDAVVVCRIIRLSCQ